MASKGRRYHGIVRPKSSSNTQYNGDTRDVLKPNAEQFKQVIFKKMKKKVKDKI